MLRKMRCFPKTLRSPQLQQSPNYPRLLLSPQDLLLHSLLPLPPLRTPSNPILPPLSQSFPRNHRRFLERIPVLLGTPQ